MAETAVIRGNAETMPWKNGAGRTREIAVHPPAAGMDDFLWRVSVAEISAASPFSLFPGIERQLLLLDGDGMTLELPTGSHWLSRPYEVLGFAGEDRVNCTPSGRCLALNVMTRRGSAFAEIDIVHGSHTSEGHSGQSLFLVARGDYRCSARTGLFELQQGDAVLVVADALNFDAAPDAVLIELTFWL